MNTLLQIAQQAPERRKLSPIARMEREFIRYVMDDIERGYLTVESAAVKMSMCGIPPHVMADVLARAQQQDVVSEWPELCASVTLPRYEPDGWRSKL